MWRLGALVVFLGSGCSDPVEPLIDVPPRKCLREISPSSYDVYFVIDVSGSMGPFLTDVKDELIGFANNIPMFNADGLAVTVQFSVMAFVNDVRWYPARTQHLKNISLVQDAFEEAINDGKDNRNLLAPTVNAEAEENLLDALRAVLDVRPEAEANLVMLATDASFRESPDTLSGSIPVQTTFEEVYTGLVEVEARVHGFVWPDTDGLTRGYRNLPALTSLPGSSVHDLSKLVGAREKVRETLTQIAESLDCN